jgi:hypothetical protein
MADDDKIPGRDLPFELLASDECVAGIGKRLRDGGKADFTVTNVTLRYMGHESVIVAWETVSAGFGEVTLYRRGGKLRCDSEAMGPDFVKAVLAKLVDGAAFD